MTDGFKTAHCLLLFQVIPMKEIENPKTLLLFVHGFLGSESSFSNFPLDLVQSIRTQYKIPNIEARVFPFFATKGDPNKAINLLYNWLLLNATQPEYEGVIIMAHSMGKYWHSKKMMSLYQIIQRSLRLPLQIYISPRMSILGNQQSKKKPKKLTQKKVHYHHQTQLDRT
ncbi:hypothetical protein BC833DRAFT_103433 [Globomyces pollinis-pini]|nr:hypothetical protein BC833DRAFT_103433 [Globomyces pollinis-pini]